MARTIYTVGGHLATISNTALCHILPDWSYRLYGNGVNVTAKSMWDTGLYMNTFTGLSGTTLEVINDDAITAISMFKNCDKLTAIPDNSFNNAIGLGNSFVGCTSLSSIHNNCFNAISNVDTVFPNVTTIGNNCFNNCSGVVSSQDTHVVLFPNLLEIGNDCFANVEHIPADTTPIVPLTVTSIGSGCFTNTEALTNTAVFQGYTGRIWPSAVTAIKEHCFDNTTSFLCSFCDSDLVTFPVTSFPKLKACQGAFSGCTALNIKAIDFIEAHPDITGYNGGGCFRGCTALADYDTATAQYPIWFMSRN